MGISQMLKDLGSHLEQGTALAASHLPGLIEWAERAEADPLVQAALDLAVPASTRTMLAGVLKTVEAEVQQVEAATKAQAEADAQAPPADPPADPPAAA